MNLRNTLLLVAVLLTFGANWALRPGPVRPTRSPLSNMAESVPYDAYSANPVFTDGMTLREPPAGTVPFGRPPLGYAATPADALRAGRELTNPVPDDAAARERGQAVYATYCTPCHGADGSGMGPVAQRGFPPPPSLLAARARQMRDGQVLHIITYGQNNMPAHAAQIALDDRWRTVRYLRGLQRAGGATP